MPAPAPPPGEVPWERRRLSFGGTAQEYDAWRPGYPDDALRWALGEAPLHVVDVGAGTGRLGAAAERLGHAVTAIEPDDAMRDVAAAALSGPVLAGTAEALPLPDAAADVVLVGQAWHWFDPARAVPEIARVLRPAGVLGILWNIRDARADWVRALAELVGGEDRAPGLGDLPAVSLGAAFAGAERRMIDHRQRLRVQDLPRLAATWSYVRLRPDRDAVLAAVARLVRTHPDLAGREEIELPYRCLAIRARRTAGT